MTAPIGYKGLDAFSLYPASSFSLAPDEERKEGDVAMEAPSYHSAGSADNANHNADDNCDFSPLLLMEWNAIWENTCSAHEAVVEFELMSVQVDDVVWNNILNDISRLPANKMVKARFIDMRLTPEQLRSLREYRSKIYTLALIDIEKNNVKNFLTALQDFLRENNYLRGLILNNVSKGDGDLTAILNLIHAQNMALECLDLYDNQLQDTDAKLLGQWSANQQQLHSLDISKNSNPKALKMFLQELSLPSEKRSFLTSFKYSLNHPSLDDLSHFLMSLPELRELHLERGLQHQETKKLLIAILMTHSKIVHLDLSGTPLTNRDLLILLSNLKHASDKDKLHTPLIRERNLTLVIDEESNPPLRADEWERHDKLLEFFQIDAPNEDRVVAPHALFTAVKSTKKVTQALLDRIVLEVNADIKEWAFIQLLIRQFDYVPTAKDGNCLFSAVALSFDDEGVTPEDMRALAVAGIRSSYPENNGVFGLETPEVYCNKMSKEKTWGGALEIQSLANLLERHIFIYDPDNTRMTIDKMGFVELPNFMKYTPSGDVSHAPIRLLRANNHYSLLKLKELPGRRLHSAEDYTEDGMRKQTSAAAAAAAV